MTQCNSVASIPESEHCLIINTYTGFLLPRPTGMSINLHGKEELQVVPSRWHTNSNAKENLHILTNMILQREIFMRWKFFKIFVNFRGSMKISCTPILPERDCWKAEDLYFKKICTNSLHTNCLFVKISCRDFFLFCSIQGIMKCRTSSFPFMYGLWLSCSMKA